MSLLRVISSIYPVSLPLSLLNPSGGSDGLARGGAAGRAVSVPSSSSLAFDPLGGLRLSQSPPQSQWNLSAIE